MENIIEIDGKRYKVTLHECVEEVTSLPDKWYTDATTEANEWGKAVCAILWENKWKYVGNHEGYVSDGCNTEPYFLGDGYTYITPTQFIEWVYNPWKESLKPKAPTMIEEVLERVNSVWKHDEKELDKMRFPTEAHAKSVLALCQLYNVAKCLNECFEGDEEPNRFWTVLRDREIYDFDGYYINTEVIRFTSRAAAQHAADHFWHLFADFYMLEDKR